MPSSSGKTLLDHISTLKDPRIERRKIYPLNEILLIVFCAVICGAESWRDLAWFGECKIEFLRKILSFEHGIPSKNTFQRVLVALDPEAFKRCFMEWVRQLQETIGEKIHIDGKTLRRSFDRAKGESALHLLCAYASESGLVLGQEKVQDHSNEITAIPKLLEVLYLKGTIVTIDAMGCQTDIAAKIIDAKADYVLALKGNQGLMHEEIQSLFQDETSLKEMNFHEQADKGHGRMEIRKCWATQDLDWWQAKKEWPGLQSAVMVESTRTFKDHETTERRFYISSLSANAGQLSQCIRSHWAIENTLHWTLDMTFREDESRIRDRIAAENMATVRRFTFNLLKQFKKRQGLKPDASIKGLRKSAGWSDSTLETMILQEF